MYKIVAILYINISSYKYDIIYFGVRQPWNNLGLKRLLSRLIKDDEYKS